MSKKRPQMIKDGGTKMINNHSIMLYLGRVITSKNETTARLLEAGFEVIAVVNDS